MKIKSLIDKIIDFFISDLKHTKNKNQFRSTVLLNFFTFLGLLYLLIMYFSFGIHSTNLLYKNTLLTFIVLVILVLLQYKILLNTKFTLFLIVSLMFLLEVALVLYLGMGYTGVLWLYIFPILAILTLGKTTGTIYSTILLILVLLFFKYPPSFATVYPQNFFVRVILTYLAVVMLTYIYELERSSALKRYATMLKDRNKLLDKLIVKSSELEYQSLDLTAANQELEKLSLVARETNNSILIANSDFEIIWVNKAFKELYGYNLLEYKKKCKDIFVCSGNLQELENVVKNKQKAEYINKAITKYGNEIWVKTNVTPVLNVNGEIKYIIFLESDITKIILFKNEIIEKNNELTQQKEEILRQKDELLKKNEVISHYNKVITQSIQFAESVQKSIFPSIELLNDLFKNFVIFQPRDIISGDFYWFQEIKDSFLFAVADCTGHGVAGAFMSVIGTRLLNEIIYIKKIYNPSEIIERLDEYWRKSINQNMLENEEGMEIILARIYKTKEKIKKIKYCGAKRPLIYYDIQNKKVVWENGVRKNIGGRLSSYNHEKFIDKELFLTEGSILYLTSDGYTDQHNNQRRRFGTKRFLNLLYEISDLSLSKQKVKLLFSFELYKEDQVQTDDVTIMAIKI